MIRTNTWLSVSFPRAKVQVGSIILRKKNIHVNLQYIETLTRDKKRVNRTWFRCFHLIDIFLSFQFLEYCWNFQFLVKKKLCFAQWCYCDNSRNGGFFLSRLTSTCDFTSDGFCLPNSVNTSAWIRKKGELLYICTIVFFLF